MPYHNISADLTASDLHQIKAALNTIQTKLPKHQAHGHNAHTPDVINFTQK